MFERIPKELKEEGLFCLYKMEQRKVEKKNDAKAVSQKMFKVV
ncbi:MAG: hypothetical protein UEA60_01040 [Lachnospiraceae bacterium]|nr:hypothetical protein [Lachnospiraceae bacterium]